MIPAGSSPVKIAVLTRAARPAAMLLRVFTRMQKNWGRIYYTLRLMAQVSDMDASVECDGPVRVSGTAAITMGPRCRLGAETELQTNGAGSIVLGSDIRINRGCTIVSYARVSIGDFAIIGEYVTIRDANHGMKTDEPMRYQPHTSAPVCIGTDVWVGRGACILPGVSIGAGAVIGANSVVTHDIPGLAIAAGMPAEIIRMRQ
jgi:acetyltransferase-like isoleucine patch superfamily enzyme